MPLARESCVTNRKAAQNIKESVMSLNRLRTAVVAAALLASTLLASTGALAGPPKDQLVLWLRADSGLAKDGSSWLDKSGKGHNATAIQGEAPTYVPKAIHGLPAAEFSGAQAMTIVGPLLTSQQFTIIALVTDTGLNEGLGLRRDVISNWSQATGPESIYFGTVTSQVSKNNPKQVDRIRFTDEIGGSTDKKNPEGGEGKINKPTTPFEFGGISNTKNARIFVNGKTAYTLTQPFSTRDETMPWYIGQQGAAGIEYYIGDIAEILVYNKALTPAELKAVTAYLHKKWQ
jgi:hypothetical protein